MNEFCTINMYLFRVVKWNNCLKAQGNNELLLDSYLVGRWVGGYLLIEGSVMNKRLSAQIDTSPTFPKYNLCLMGMFQDI